MEKEQKEVKAQDLTAECQIIIQVVDIWVFLVYLSTYVKNTGGGGEEINDIKKKKVGDCSRLRS